MFLSKTKYCEVNKVISVKIRNKVTLVEHLVSTNKNMETKKYVILPKMIERKKVYGIASTSIGIKTNLSYPSYLIDN